MAELKPGWQRVKFGDVVRLNKETCKDPTAEGIERVIGLEHLEPGDLRMRSWGNVADGTKFTNRVRPGQVLFGKRRAYQRKVAVANSDAVCSGDIYVLESADPMLLLPEILPFICQTESFFQHAIGTSAGSLSPRTNWSSLSSYKFTLPPIESQHRLVYLLSAGLSLQGSLADAKSAAKALLSAALLHEFTAIQTSKPLQQLCSSDITYGIVQAGENIENGIPYVRVSEMTDRHALNPDEMMRTSNEIALRYSRTELRAGDVVVALRGVPGLAQQVPASLDGGNLSRGVARVAPGPGINPRYLLWALRSPITQARVLQYANGWKGEDLREITIRDLRALPIPICNQQRQELLAARLDQLEQALIASEKRMTSCNQYLSNMRSNLFGDH